MSYYEAPPLRSQRGRSRRDSFSTPPLRHNATFYPHEAKRAAQPYAPYEPQDRDYPSSRSRSRAAKPRVVNVSPPRESFPERAGGRVFHDDSDDSDDFDDFDDGKYAHSPSSSPIRSRSPSPPRMHHPESGTSYKRAQARGREKARDAGQYGRNVNGEGSGGKYWDSSIPASRGEGPPPRFQTPPFQKSTQSRPQAHSHSHPPPRSYTTPPPRTQTQPQSNTTPLPHSPIPDISPCAYTYSDDEPDTIPCRSAQWNKHASCATKEQLLDYFVDRGVHPKRAAAAVDREFAAYAPQWVVGEGMKASRAEERGREESRREESRRERSVSPKPKSRGSESKAHGSNRARRHSPPPSAYRSPSPVFGRPSRQRSSSSSSHTRYRAPSSSKTPDAGMRRHGSKRGDEPRREKKTEREEESRGDRRERRDRRDPGMKAPRAPSPPPAASREDVRRERRRER